MEHQTLILTPWMAPHRICSWQEAICLLVKESADVLEEYEETVSSPSMTMGIPSVLRLRRAVATHKKGVKFSRVNVFTRDGFSCQYCGAKKPMKDLNYDHVIPRVRGGKTVWENIATSCYPCNDRKAGRTPEQAGMKLIRQPTRPKTLPMSQPMLGFKTVPPEWAAYIDPAFLVGVGLEAPSGELVGQLDPEPASVQPEDRGGDGPSSRAPPARLLAVAAFQLDQHLPLPVTSGAGYEGVLLFPGHEVPGEEVAVRVSSLVAHA